LQALAQYLPIFAAFSTTVLVRSDYKQGQFSEGALQYLCVPGVSSDCEIDECLTSFTFDFTFTKTEKSALSSQEFLDWLALSIAEGTSTYFLCGFLLEHCILSTAMELRDAVPSTSRVVVITDLVASRTSKYRINDFLMNTLKQLSANGIDLLSSKEVQQYATPQRIFGLVVENIDHD